MKQVLRTISFLGLFLFIEGFLLSVLARTETTNKEVLVLNSINFNLPWAKNFYWCIHDALQKQGISAKAESLSVPALANKMEADAVVTHLREKYPVAPAAIVLIGDPGWIVCRELFDDVWKDVPVIVTNARDRLPASLDVLLSHAPLTETNSVPGEEWRRGYNLTLLKQHYYVKETVELIYKLIPDMQRLAFISDDRYISEETRRDVKEAVEENFPDLRLDLLSTTQLSTEMLLDTLHSYKPNTGIIYYSWFESHNENDNNYLFDHIQEIITNFTPSPLFLLSPENLSNNTFAGGYYVSTESFCDSLLEILNRILNGEQARNIPGGVGGEGNSYLCYPVLKSYNIPSSRYPDDAVYIDKPQTFFQQHYVKIIASSVFLLLLIAAIVYYIRILRKAYSRLSEAVEKAEQANQLKSAFLANMSHEIRTGHFCRFQKATDYRKQQNYKEWVHIAPKFDDDFFKTEEAQRIGDNVLLYQQTTGGWPKNIYMPAELTEQEYNAALKAKEDTNQSTIDNNATTTEIEYLSRLYLATQKEKYKEGVLNGIQYLLKSQYENGGWPQFYPRPKGYYVQITYNDNAMVRVMNQLRSIYEKKAPYTFLPDNICEQARNAFNKGIECILKTQVRQNGELTVWCAQHDRVTLEPCKARAYELPSLSGQESDNIVLLLMSLPHPSADVVKSIEGAIKWFQKSEIKGIQKEYFTNSDGKKDYRMVPCEDCPTLWARFYDLETNRPFFCDRDGIKKYDISEIGHERRNGYSWYNKDGSKVLKRYEKWKKEQNK